MPTAANSQLPVLPLAALGVIIIGSIGPWVTVDGLSGFSEGGLESDGMITLILSLIIGGLLFAYRNRPRPKGVVIGIGIGALLCLVIAIIDVLDVTGSDLPVEVNVGWGLWLTLVGSIGLIVALGVSRARDSAGGPSLPE